MCPAVQASIAANTYVIIGVAETKSEPLQTLRIVACVHTVGKTLLHERAAAVAAVLLEARILLFSGVDK